MARVPIRFIKQYVQDGRPYFYFRRRGCPSVRLPGLPGSPEFMEAYRAAFAGAPLPKSVSATRILAGSFAELVANYYASPTFLELSPRTQTIYRRAIDKLRTDYGNNALSAFDQSAVLSVLNDRTTAASRNEALIALRRLAAFAVEQQTLKVNPTLGIKSTKVVSKGFPIWTEEDVRRFEARHPLGTMARLALCLMLYTGCRRGDVRLLGRQHVRNGELTYTQEKNKRRNPITLTIRVHSELQRAIDAMPPSPHLTFVLTNQGKPFASSASFGVWWRERCDEAGLTVAAHGLRKLLATRLSDKGRTPQEIAAVTGHQTLKEVDRYTKARDQKLAAQRAIEALETRTETVQPADDLDKSTKSASKNKRQKGP
jgi:integrase